MRNSTEIQIKLITPLVEVCNDGAVGYADLAKNLEKEDLKTLFYRFSQQRKLYAEELNNEILVLGGEVIKTGSVEGKMHQAWLKIKSFFNSDDDEALIEACLIAEEYAAKTYSDRIMDADLSAHLREVITKQHSMIEGAHQQLSSLAKENA